jgi:hypothetical protein
MSLAADLPLLVVGQRNPAARPRVGSLALLSVTAVFGLLVVSAADNAARDGVSWAGTLFWVGLLMTFLPIAARLLLPAASREERLALVSILGLSLYLVKVFHSPAGFTLHDEFIHWRNVQNTLSSGHLFQQNPALPVTADFPGLQAVTTAVVQLTGLPIFAAGLLVVGVARLVAVLALFLLFESVSRSAWVAGVATALYAANPGFMFFDAAFSYESLAVPLALMTLFILARRVEDRANHLALSLAATLGIGAVVVTHHVTSYLLATFLTIWAIAALITRRHRRGDRGVWDAALFAWAAAILWLIFVANLTVGYLAPHLLGATRQTLSLIAHEGSARQLFKTYSGQFSPVWEQTMGYAATVLILGGLALSFPQLWRRYRWNPAAIALGVAALGYPLSLPFRLTSAGAETASRTTEFVFIGIAFVIGIGVVELWLERTTAWRKVGLALAGAAIIFMGGVIVGFAPWSRLPGPYLVAADSRSIEPEGITAAKWAQVWLGPNQRIVADRTNALLMGSYGDEHPAATWAIVLSRKFGRNQLNLIRKGQVHYVVTDRRLAEALPVTGVYFEQGEADAQKYTFPIDFQDFTKFDQSPSISRIFDGGDIVIYDTGGLLR